MLDPLIFLTQQFILAFLFSTTLVRPNNLKLCNEKFNLTLTKTLEVSTTSAKIDSKGFLEGKFWSEKVERYVEKRRIKYNVKYDKSQRFVLVRRGCGRMKNRLLETETGERFCARYRDNIEQLQGEYYGYHISSLLEIKNVLPVYPERVNPSSERWQAVWSDLEIIGWRPHAVILLSPWITGLIPVTAPSYITDHSKKRLQSHNINSVEDASYLLQWSDMIIFDYITGNVDRIISQKHCLKWDRLAMHHAVHNLNKDQKGIIVFIDNESGLSHSYRLMSQYQHLHDEALAQICYFRNSTAVAIKKLSKITKINLYMLLNELHSHDLIPNLTSETLQILQQRIYNARKHIYEVCHNS